MSQFDEGDRVRVDIPDETDEDHRWHGNHGEIIEILDDDAGLATGDERDSVIYRVRLTESERTLDLRWRDLRPPLR